MRLTLDLPPGVISDETTFSTQGRWADADKARPWRGRMQAIGGWVKAIEDALTGTCRNALSWIDSTVQQNIAFGTHSALMVLKGSTLADITPSGLASGNIDRNELGFGQGPFGLGPFGGGPLAQYYPRTWSLATWGENLMANPRGRGLYVWENDTSVDATVISQAPSNISCMLVNAYRQVMAFGCNEYGGGGDYNPMYIRWSDFEDYEEWTPGTGNNAGFKQLEGGGRIVGAGLMGNSILVWTDTSLFLGTYTGSAGVDLWRFDLIANNCGLAAPNAFTVINQAAYWLTPDLQFYSYQVGFPPAPIPCPIRNDFKDNLDYDQIDKVVSTSITEFGEVWFLYPDARDGNENSRFVAVNLSDNTWFRGTLERTAAIDSGPQRYPVMVDPTSYVYFHENGNDADGGALEWSIRTADMYLDDAQRRVDLDGIWPDFEDQQGTVYLRIWTKNYPHGEAKAKGPYALAPGREKRDFLINTRIASLEFYQEAAPAFARMGTPSFGVQVAGER